MNAKQRDELMAIIIGDCGAVGHYIGQDGDTCVVGAIALKAGVIPERLTQANTSGITHPTLAGVRRDIYCRFGLSEDELHRLQLVNDSYSKTIDRRSAVLSKLMEFEVTRV